MLYDARDEDGCPLDECDAGSGWGRSTVREGARYGLLVVEALLSVEEGWDEPEYRGEPLVIDEGMGGRL